MSRTEPSTTGDKPQRPPVSRRRKWLKRGAITAVVLFVGYTLFGFFGVPAIARHVVVPRISEQLNGTAVAGGASFNPFTLGLVIRDLDVTDEAGQTVLGVERFEGSLDLIGTVFKRGYWFGYARVQAPAIHAEFDADRALNLIALVYPPPVSPEPGDGSPQAPLEFIPRIVVKELAVSGASLQVRDLAFDPPFEKAIHDVEFTVRRLDTDPAHDNPHTLDAQIGTEATIAWEGIAHVDPLTAEGALAIESIDLASYSPYVNELTGIDLERGRLDLDLSYAFAPVRSGNRLVLDLRGVTVKDLRATDRGRPLVEAEHVEVAGLKGDVDAGLLTVESVSVRGASASVRRNADGRFELVELVTDEQYLGGLVQGKGQTSGAGTQRADLESIQYPLQRLRAAVEYLIEDLTAGWQVDVSSVTVSATSLHFTDDATPTPVDVTLNDISVNAGPASTTDGFRTPVELSARTDDDATLRLSGVVDPMNLSVDAEVACEALRVQRFAAYLPPDLPPPLRDAQITSVVVSAEGRVEAKVGPDDLEARYVGRGEVADVAVTLALKDLPATAPLQEATILLATGRLEDATIEWRDGVGSLDAAALDLVEPRIEAIAAGAATPPAEPAETAEPETDTPAAVGIAQLPLAARIGRVTISEGGCLVEDTSVEPPLTLEASGFRMTAEPIDTASAAPTDVDLAVQIAALGNVGVTGQASPFLEVPALDFMITITDMPLRPFSPMAAPRVGYTIDSGRLTMSFPVTVEEGRLEGEIDARLASFYLGEKVPSETAPDVPLKLGLDLLRDSDDVVAAQLPISGDITDPNFSLDAIIWEAAFNLVGSVALAPFKLIGNLVGAGDDVDLSRVAFEPGGVELVSDDVSKVDLLARALGDRPGLRLTLTGVYGPSDDLALRDAALRTLVEQTMVSDARADSETAALRLLFDERYPDRPDVTIPVPPGRFDQTQRTQAEMREWLLASLEVTPETLAGLASERATRVQAMLVDGGIDATRVQIVPLEAARQGRAIEPAATVEFELLAAD